MIGNLGGHMKTSKLVSNILSVKKELLTSQLVFSCKSYEQGEKGKDLPSNRAVGREHPLTPNFSARHISFRYSFLTLYLSIQIEKVETADHKISFTNLKFLYCFNI